MFSGRSVYAVTCRYLASLMRFIDSMTLVTSDDGGQQACSSWPVLTRPLLSWELEIFTGVALGIIMVIGAMELPPDIELLRADEIEQAAARAVLVDARTWDCAD